MQFSLEAKHDLSVSSLGHDHASCFIIHTSCQHLKRSRPARLMELTLRCSSRRAHSAPSSYSLNDPTFETTFLAFPVILTGLGRGLRGRSVCRGSNDFESTFFSPPEIVSKPNLPSPTSDNYIGLPHRNRAERGERSLHFFQVVRGRPDRPSRRRRFVLGRQFDEMGI